MTRTRKQDVWVASVRISIPIDATEPASIARAQESVRKLASLIPGSSVEITHAGFGRMVAPTVALPPPPQLNLIANMDGAMREIREQVLQPAPEPEIPESLRRVPRHVPNGTDGAA